MLLLTCATVFCETEREIEFVETRLDNKTTGIALPEIDKLELGSFVVGEIEFSIEQHDGMFRFEATTDSDRRVQWVSQEDTHARFIFNANEKKFERLAHTVRVVLSDYDKFEELVEDTSAIGGRAFPQLDYATLTLPKNVNPISFVMEISDREEVKEAFPETEKPRQFPQ